MSNTKDNAATTAKNETVSTTVTVVELVEPQVLTLIGSVEAINFKPSNSDAGGKFKHDTHIVSLSVPRKGKEGLEFVTETVFITAKQFTEYGCDKSVYVGNYVKLSVEDCIKDVTGYYDQADDAELTPHEKSFKAFAGIAEATADLLMLRFDSIGVSERMSDRIIANVMLTRRNNAELKTLAAVKDTYN